MVSGCYSTINKEKKKSERLLEQESAGRMLQRAAQRKAGVSQLQEQVGQTDDSETYGGQHVFLGQCFSTAGPRPGTGTWHQLYRAASGSTGLCHFSFLSIFHE